MKTSSPVLGRGLIRAGLTCLALLAGAARADVTLNLKDADIGTLIQTVSEVTGKNFIVDPRVKGKVTVVSSTPMGPEGLYETFLAVLQVQGFAAIPAGDVIKIVPETNARQDGGSATSSGAGLAIDEVVTHVYTIQNVSAAQLVPILRPLVPQWGHLAAYASSNMLIISDRAANVQRLETLIRQIDQSGDRGVEIVKLQFASAADVVRVLTSLAQGARQAEAGAPIPPVAAIADERSNSVLIAGDRTERQKLLEVISQLDIPVGEDGATQVVYLRYASAENLAPILEGYAQQVNQAPGGAAPVPTGQPAGAGGAGGVRVLADNDTNALIITAPPKTMRQVRDVIAKLDIQRAQVLVDAIIAEVSASQSGQLGIDWAIFNGDRIAAASLLDPATTAAISGLGALTGGTGTGAGSGNSDLAALGLLGSGINVVAGADGGDGGTSFAILLKAIKGDGNSNVLSTPTLVTLDNEEAEISVGQEVPFLTGSFSNTGGGGGNNGVNPFQTIERRDVGLTLGITPQVNEGNTIKLKLNLEVSSLDRSSTSAVDLVTNKRTLTNTVSVEDNQVLVIGGLIDDNDNAGQSGIPFLSDIPLIGSLFKFRSVAKAKRNLMIFIRPAILRKKSDGDYYSRRKYDSLRDLQLSTGKGAIPLIGGQRIILDPYESLARTDREPNAIPATTAPEEGPAPAPQAIAPEAGTAAPTYLPPPDEAPGAVDPAPQP